MPTGIDVNRGVMIKKHPGLGLIYMYLDAPGVFLNAHGSEVPDKVAKGANYDTETLGKEKVKRERMREAMTAIEIELELAVTSDEENVIEERDGFRVVGLALGNAHLYDPDNNKLTPVPVPEAEALKLLDHLAPVKEEKKND